MNGFLLASQKVPGRRTLPSKPIHEEKNPSKHPGPGAGLDFLGETSPKLLGDSISTSPEIMGKSWEHLTKKNSSGCWLLFF